MRVPSLPGALQAGCHHHHLMDKDTGTERLNGSCRHTQTARDCTGFAALCCGSSLPPQVVPPRHGEGVAPGEGLRLGTGWATFRGIPALLRASVSTSGKWGEIRGGPKKSWHWHGKESWGSGGFWTCCSCCLSFKPPEDQPCLVPMGAGLAASEGVVAEAFEGDGRPHTDASCGVLWVLWRHPGPQETPTWGPTGPLFLCPAGGSRVEELPSPSPQLSLCPRSLHPSLPNSRDLG